ncbi:hypothetical protein FCV51_00635 [Vibrio kanaloae]|nr:hypothetical protein FCV46_07710 [Vibrio kanaloae]TKF66148.1 hypothetical protein FCV51_00635 [Vibrio kanaloae]
MVSIICRFNRFERLIAEQHKVIDLSHGLKLAVIIVSLHFVTLRNEFSTIHFGAHNESCNKTFVIGCTCRPWSDSSRLHNHTRYR